MAQLSWHGWRRRMHMSYAYVHMLLCSSVSSRLNSIRLVRHELQQSTRHLHTQVRLYNYLQRNT